MKPAAPLMDIPATSADEAAQGATIQISRLGLLIFLLGYYAATSFGYVYFVQDVYGSYYYRMGHVFSPGYLSLSLLFLAVAGFLIPTDIHRPSNFFLLVGLLFPVIPMGVLVAFSDFDIEFLLFSIASLAVVFLTSRSPLGASWGFGLSLVQLAVFSALLALGILMLVGIQSGFQYVTLSFTEVYSNREALNQFTGLLAYLINWSRLTLVGIVCAVGFARRSMPLILAGLFLSVFGFIMTSQKSAIMLWGIIGAVHLLFAFRYGRLIVGFVLLGLPLASVAAYLYFDSLEIGIVWFRRIYIMPAWLNFAYFDVFNMLPQIYWADSSVGFWNASTMNVSSAVLVGEFLGFRGAHANTGWIGTGYMHAGFAGMLIYAVIIGLVLRLADTFATKMPPVVVISILFLPMKTLLDSSDLPGTFLTYALGPTLAILWCAMPSPTRIVRQNEAGDRARIATSGAPSPAR